MHHIGGNARPCATHRLGRKKRRIGFAHDPVIGNQLGSGCYFGRAAKGNDTGETDPRSEVKNRTGIIGGLREAMKYKAVRRQATRAQDRQ